MKAATESSDKEKTHALPDGNIDLKEHFNIFFKMEAKNDFKEYNVANFKDDWLTFKVMNKVLPRRTSRTSWLTFKDDFKDDFGIGIGRTSPHQDLHHATSAVCL